MVSSAPSARARPSFSSEDDVTITRAPWAFANCSAKSETPPVPSTRAVLCGPKAALRTARQAVVAAIGRVAASASDKCAGVRTSECAGTVTYSARLPGRSMPRRGPPPTAGILPSCQLGMKCGMTRAPIFQPVTAVPSAATSPAPSVTGMIGKWLSGYLPVATAISRS